jgi:hypothetical protein
VIEGSSSVIEGSDLKIEGSDLKIQVEISPILFVSRLMVLVIGVKLAIRNSTLR